MVSKWDNIVSIARGYAKTALLKKIGEEETQKLFAPLDRKIERDRATSLAIELEEIGEAIKQADSLEFAENSGSNNIFGELDPFENSNVELDGVAQRNIGVRGVDEHPENQLPTDENDLNL